MGIAANLAALARSISAGKLTGATMALFVGSGGVVVSGSNRAGGAGVAGQIIIEY